MLVQLQRMTRVNSLAFPSLGMVALFHYFSFISFSRGGQLLLTNLKDSTASTWITLFKDLHLILFFFPAGLFLSIKKVFMPMFVDS